MIEKQSTHHLSREITFWCCDLISGNDNLYAPKAIVVRTMSKIIYVFTKYYWMSVATKIIFDDSLFIYNIKDGKCHFDVSKDQTTY